LIKGLIARGLIENPNPDQPWKFTANYFLKDGKEFNSDNIRPYASRPSSGKSKRIAKEIFQEIKQAEQSNE
jgi:hypothetical protein